MGYLIGAAMAAAVGLLATIVGFDRDRAFYPTVMIVIASYYVLFALSGGTTSTIVIETAVMALFAGAAIAGFKRSMWLVVAALAAHGVFDWFHSPIISNPGVVAAILPGLRCRCSWLSSHSSCTDDGYLATLN